MTTERARLAATLDSLHDNLTTARTHWEDDECLMQAAITSEHRGQYQTFDAYASLSEESRDKVDAIMGWFDGDRTDYLDNREGGGWADRHDPETEDWLAEAICEVTGWYWEDGSLWEDLSATHCPICRDYPDSSPRDAVMHWLDSAIVEVVASIGRPLEVVFTAQGPTITLTHDLNVPTPELSGHYGNVTVTGPYDAMLYRWVMTYYVPNYGELV